MLSNARIMMIDDEPINMEVLVAHLEDEGYENFVTTSDSVNAFDKILKEEPDILLLDLMMPDVTGFEILAMLRDHESTENLPVIVLTSSDDSATKLKVLQLGATDFLAKPVDASELALRLRNTLAARQYQDRIINFDTLTGLPSKKLFESTTKDIYSYAVESGHTAALLICNIQRFKAVNDMFGRAAGDALLQSMCKRLCGAFDVDPHFLSNLSIGADYYQTLIFRLGGDSFGIVVPHVRDEQLFVEKIDKMMVDLEKVYPIENEDIFLSNSVGIAFCPDDASSAEQWVTHAESALYDVKEKNKTGYTFYNSDMDESARQYIKIESALRSALPEGQLFLVYQPKVDVATGVIVGAEALIRWNHPEFGIVSPELFISLAERSGLIIDIGTWVMEKACVQSQKWRETVYSDFKIAVNVSVRQLEDEGFVDVVSNTLSTTGIDPGALQLELTENMIMSNPEKTVEILENLKNLGVFLSVDDFGTGYSSLSYLQKFPIDELKIDRSFISEISGPLDKTPIVKAVVSLGHDLGLKLVAEGVETVHQLARLKALKCHIYQGYFCSPPVDIQEFENLLRNNNVTLDEVQRKAG